MDGFPVEIIGNILSKVGAARDVVIASATCRKWCQAFRKHLHTLTFSSDDWPSYKQRFSSHELEILITRTLFQTTALQELSISIKGVPMLSSSVVHAWLIYTQEKLRVLRYNVWTNGIVHILQMCRPDKLEVIELTYSMVMGLKPDFLIFPCLKSLTLRNERVTALDLNRLLSACPKIESLQLISLINLRTPGDKKVELSIPTPTLRSIFVESVKVDKITVEADCLEILHLKDCKLEEFELTGKGTLKQMKFDDVRVDRLNIDENIGSLEVVDIINFSIDWSTFLEMISKSSSLRRLRLWNKSTTDKKEDECVFANE